MNLQEHKAEATLSKVLSYPEGVMTRKEWVKLQHGKGATVKEALKSKTMFDRRKFNRMNYAQQEEYEKKVNTLVPCYELYCIPTEGGFYDITKAEYDYFQTL